MRCRVWKDPIVAEVRKARERYAARFGYDLSRIVADLRKNEAKLKDVKAPTARRSRKKAGSKRRKAA